MFCGIALLGYYAVRGEENPPGCADPLLQRGFGLGAVDVQIAIYLSVNVFYGFALRVFLRKIISSIDVLWDSAVGLLRR